ncbi:MAG: glycerol-3-phosphate 1-O-acyltransferase PlsY [Candidatus Omnitrophica bacterium]|nr:glycerol-3-phosphate 1-O-acyltransferase PlsY [Candidatus Omnitrophota bacterium]
MITALLIIGAYLVGSIPWGYALCRAVKKIDIRNHGSGNIGATNVYRVAGGPLAAAVLLLDIGKGLLPVILAKSFSMAPPVIVSAGIASVAGHSFSIFLKGKGGKGVSTSFGVVIALFPAPALLALLVWAVMITATHYVSAGAIAAALSMPFFIHLFHKDAFLTSTGIAICALIIYTHRGNIKRLLAKKENRIKLPWEKK